MTFLLSHLLMKMFKSTAFAKQFLKMPLILLLTTKSDLPFNDDYDVSSFLFKSMMHCFADTQSISNVDIETVERLTRGQSNNEVWRKLKRDKLTASNFYNAAVRRKEPDKLLITIMYISETHNTR